MSHQHPAEIGRDIKAERWSDRSTSQRSCQHSAEIRKSTKTESGGGATGQSPKAGQVVDPGSDLLEQKTVFKTELPHLARGGANQTELQLKDNTAAAW
jgi:hypothetical protein